jgi:hypothetical protein
VIYGSRVAAFDEFHLLSPNYEFVLGSTLLRRLPALASLHAVLERAESHAIWAPSLLILLIECLNVF